jgi:hypothetical protein
MCGESLPGFEPGQVRQVDDPPAGRAQRRCRALGAEEDSAKIEILDGVPLLRCRLVEAEPVHHCRGIDQHVELSELLDHTLWKRARRSGIRQISVEARGTPTRVEDLLLQLVRSPARCVMMNGDGHSAFRQRRSHGSAQAPPGTRYQGDAALQLHQSDPAGTGEIGRICPVTVASELARDITPSVISCIST